MKYKEKIIDILLEFYEEYQGNIPNRPMIPSIYASKIIDSLQEKPTIVCVVTRCEEHDDYVEEVFFDAKKAQKYCAKFKGNENEYARHITKIEVTL